MRTVDKQFYGAVFLVCFMFVPFYHGSAEMPVWFYSRVQMYVPKEADFYYLYGEIAPLTFRTVSYSVSYYVGIAWGEDYWVGGGWFSDVEKGNFPYCETNINGVYSEIVGDYNVTVGNFYTVQLTRAWREGHHYISVLIYENMPFGDFRRVRLIMYPFIEGLPDSNEFTAIASGESISMDNSMGSAFDKLEWATTSNKGLWDGVVYPCEIITDYPYALYCTIPYSSFVVCDLSGLSFCHGANGQPPKGNMYR